MSGTRRRKQRDWLDDLLFWIDRNTYELIVICFTLFIIYFMWWAK